MSDASAPAACPTTTEREWLVMCHCAGPVLRLVADQGWSIVDDSLANVFCTSPDGKVRIGFLPETVDAAVHDVLWRIEVDGGTKGGGWSQTFHSGTPALAVAGFVAALIAAPFSACTTCG
ncbi:MULTISPECIES: DUF317 domain-containing protein [Streptomyces]|uniref:DUF317 domain-containing protein n=1 Tax=Streptomyces TaxID=1883 RepID=UPI000CD4E2DD|nr:MULTISPECIES: DUF317 domain-containing protein [Streptomyces]